MIPPPPYAPRSESHPHEPLRDPKLPSLEEIETVIASEAERWSSRLREVSIQIHGHPELAYNEVFAHKVLTTFLIKQGFDVTPHYILKTAFKASFTSPTVKSVPPSKDQSWWRKIAGKSKETELGGDKEKLPSVMFQAEYDALPGIGHACGHNLIAVSSLFAILALRHLMIMYKVSSIVPSSATRLIKELDFSSFALLLFQIPGTISVLGTPAEEGGGGKIPLLAAGAYEGVDACLMCHPGPGPSLDEENWGSIRPSLAIQTIHADYVGKAAHAAVAPWEGINALDAAMLAYSNISAFRQQMVPGDRVHGIVVDGGLAPNVIPDHASLKFFIRSPKGSSLSTLRSHIDACFEGAALATSTTLHLTAAPAHLDQRNNSSMSMAYKQIMSDCFKQDIVIVGSSDGGAGGGSFSTDFGNVTYAVPSMGSNYAIPTVAKGGNHTSPFTLAARSEAAHRATVKASVGLAVLGARVLMEKEFRKEVREDFEKGKLT
ncbi:hypothetical protein BDY24DRAFT_361909 [Mrakia frigida]|uniref:uncharacterized protein n=1 Tax=Mrakia frigida TaxID=29902 RepID=UPI003FCC0EC7